MFCKKCGKEIQEDWSACPNCGEAIVHNKPKEKSEKEVSKNSSKVRGTSNAPVVLGIVGGVLGLPSALCSGMCSSIVGATESTEMANELGNFYLFGILIGSIIAIVFACQTRKKPKIAGVMLLIATFIIGLLSTFTFNLLGIIAAVLTLIAAIMSFIQKKEKI